jgi:hypothetical protein
MRTAEFDRSADRCAVQPCWQRFGTAKRSGPFRKSHEGDLEYVIDGIWIGEKSAGDPENQWPVPRHDGSKRRLVASGSEPIEQVGV